MAKDAPIFSSDDDFVYLQSEAALIIKKTPRTITRYYADGIKSKDKLYSQSDQDAKKMHSFISASSLVEFAKKYPERIESIDYDRVIEYTPDNMTKFLEQFKEVSDMITSVRQTAPEPVQSDTPQRPTLNSAGDRQEVVDLYREMLDKANEELKVLKRQNADLSDELLDTIRTESKQYQLVAIQKENVVAQMRALIDRFNDKIEQRNSLLESAKKGTIDYKRLPPTPLMDTNGEWIRIEGPQQTNMFGDNQPRARQVYDAEVIDITPRKRNWKRGVAITGAGLSVVGLLVWAAYFFQWVRF